jgi:hypothetical protein
VYRGHLIETSAVRVGNEEWAPMARVSWDHGPHYTIQEIHPSEDWQSEDVALVHAVAVEFARKWIDDRLAVEQEPERDK